ncbi:MAG: hypothetical protein HZC44_06285 [Geobacter sp.]|nr:hypothetical protein [Geobacter sp.]
MALVNHAKREINAKIVYCGPSAAGKGSILKAICSKLPPGLRGALRSMALQQDRMLFFDLTHPEGREPDGYRVRFHIYTLTGDVTQENAWKMVLKGVDGLAIALDSDPARQSANSDLLDEVQTALHGYGKNLDEVAPLVLCTKRDLPDALPMEQMRESLGIGQRPLVPVSATSGEGVMEAIGELMDAILDNLEDLGLLLQSTVSSLRDLCPARQQTPIPEVTDSPVAAVALAVEPPSDLPAREEFRDQDKPLISVAGPAEIDDTGALQVPLVLNCCDRSAKLVLTISFK